MSTETPTTDHTDLEFIADVACRVLAQCSPDEAQARVRAFADNLDAFEAMGSDGRVPLEALYVLAELLVLHCVRLVKEPEANPASLDVVAGILEKFGVTGAVARELERQAVQPTPAEPVVTQAKPEPKEPMLVNTNPKDDLPPSLDIPTEALELDLDELRKKYSTGT